MNSGATKDSTAIMCVFLKGFSVRLICYGIRSQTN